MVQSWTRAAASAANYGSDDMFYNHYNAWLTLHGQNPYTGQRLSGAIGYFHINAYTPIARGRFADPQHDPSGAERDTIAAEFLAHPQTPPPEIDPRTTHSYPAGAFLLALPAVWAGLPSIAWPQMAALLALWLAVALATPRRWRPAVALLPLLEVDGARLAAGRYFEIWPLVFLSGAWLTARRGWP
ncbi:MAG: hypothetical protein IVW57_11495, partial [Ktedonobacterales bacterium]|nr:hypothetical protein [Ktedonobacterales bacterium]